MIFARATSLPEKKVMRARRFEMFDDNFDIEMSGRPGHRREDGIGAGHGGLGQSERREEYCRVHAAEGVAAHSWPEFCWRGRGCPAKWIGAEA
jgi:hypothetical protein